MKKKKLNLEKLQVKSFVTGLTDTNDLKGGGATQIPQVCISVVQGEICNYSNAIGCMTDLYSAVIC